MQPGACCLPGVTGGPLTAGQLNAAPPAGSGAQMERTTSHTTLTVLQSFRLAATSPGSHSRCAQPRTKDSPSPTPAKTQPQLRSDSPAPTSPTRLTTSSPTFNALVPTPASPRSRSVQPKSRNTWKSHSANFPRRPKQFASTTRESPTPTPTPSPTAVPTTPTPLRRDPRISREPQQTSPTRLTPLGLTYALEDAPMAPTPQSPDHPRPRLSVPYPR